MHKNDNWAEWEARDMEIESFAGKCTKLSSRIQLGTMPSCVHLFLTARLACCSLRYHHAAKMCSLRGYILTISFHIFHPRIKIYKYLKYYSSWFMVTKVENVFSFDNSCFPLFATVTAATSSCFSKGLPNRILSKKTCQHWIRLNLII